MHDFWGPAFFTLQHVIEDFLRVEGNWDLELPPLPIILGRQTVVWVNSPLGRIMVCHSQRISWKSPRIEGLNDFLPITLGMVGTRSSRPGSLRWDYPDYPAGRKLASSHGVNPWVDVAGGDQDPGQSKHFFLLGFRRILCVVLYLCHTLHPFCSSHIPHTLSNSWPPF